MINIDQSKLAHKLPSNSSQQPRINRLTLIIVSLSIILGAGYFSWRKIQLYVAQQLIHYCVQKHNCAEHLSALEQLVKAQQNLKLFNLATANLSSTNLQNAYLKNTNLYRANLEVLTSLMPT